jgi:biopolymer transport protein ExbD
MSEPGKEIEIGAINIPGLEDEGEPEFQVAPMVDVLLVLLLFFMATATTEVVNQTADLSLPLAENSKELEKNSGRQLEIAIEKINYRIKIGSVYFDKADDIIPEIQQRRKATDQMAGGNADTPFRVLVRADKDAPFSKVTEIMQVCAKAGVADVTFAVSNPPEQAGGAAAQP